MKSNPLKRFPKALFPILLALACVLGAGLAVHPVALAAPLPGGQVVQSWRWEWARWLYWPALAAVAAGCWVVWRTAKRGLEGSRWSAFLPLAWLPLLAFAPHGVAWVDWTLAGLVFPLGGTLLAALCLERLVFGAATGNGGGENGIPVRVRHPARLGWLLFLGATVLLSAYWRTVAEPQGYGHSGDAVYYRMMVDNLLDGKGLEMTDRMTAMMEKAGAEQVAKGLRKFASHHHMKTNAEGKIYNFHSFGFPLLAWPVFRLFGPSWGEMLSMSLVGAMALVGVFFCCLVHGVRRRAAALTTALACLSFVWVYTTFWFSPEMLGFGLVAWAFWAVAAQHDPRRRWIATAVVTLACAWMPVAHVRFAPTAAALAACFGIEGLLVKDEPFWRGKFWRLGLFSVLCFAAWGVLWWSQQRMYSGTSPYNYGHIIGRDPFAVWALFCDRRGIVALLPAAGAMLVATAFAVFRKGTVARRAAMAAAVVASTMYFCCCTAAVLEGLCLGGRYALTFVPVLLPFFAMALERADRAGRVWLLFLAAQPVLFFAFAARSAQGGALYYAPAFLRGLPPYSLFWDPFPSQYDAIPAAARAGGSLVGAAIFALSALACWRTGRRGIRFGLGLVLLAMAFFAGRTADRLAPPRRISPWDVLMEGTFSGNLRLLGVKPGDFFEAFRFPDNSGGIPDTVYVLTDDTELSHDGIQRKQIVTELPVDDWMGRPLAWGKVHHSFLSVRKHGGDLACRIAGRVERGTGHLALQMFHVSSAPEIPLGTGPFDYVFRVRVAPGGDGVNFRLALDGSTGEAVVDTMEICPCSDALLDVLGPFPESCRVLDIRDPATWADPLQPIQEEIQP